MKQKRETELPLFSWQPPKKFVVFPLVNRVGKVRDVAAKMLARTTERSIRHYRKQVDDGLTAQLERIGLGEAEIDRQLDLFWQAVDQEMHRQSYEYSDTPGGSA